MRPHRTWGCVGGGRSYVYIILTLSRSQSLTLTLTLSCVYMVGRLYYIYIYIHYIQRAILRLSQPLSFSRGATSQHERRLRWWRRSTKVYLQRVTAYLVQDICCVASTLRPAECNSVQDRPRIHHGHLLGHEQLLLVPPVSLLGVWETGR
jgi:hypothetical protein